MSSGVWILSAKNTGELCRYSLMDSQSVPPMRLWVRSYWNMRLMPDDQRMPP